MWVKYFIPEDGDDQQHPNVFQINASGNVLLGQIKQTFPIPGKYHFRCMKTIANNISVWFDLTDDNVAVPAQFDGSILLKVSRISIETTKQPAAVNSNITNKPPSNVSSTDSPRVTNPTSVKSINKPQPDSTLLSFDSFDDTSSNTQTTSPATNQSKPIVAPVKPPVASTSNADLLGIDDTPVQQFKPVKSNSSADFFGLESMQPSTATATSTNNNANKFNNMQQPAMNPMGGGMNPMAALNPATQQQSYNATLGINGRNDAFDPFSFVDNSLGSRGVGPSAANQQRRSSATPPTQPRYL